MTEQDGFFCDRRLGGFEKWYLSRPRDFMVIPDEIRKCVCFVGYEMASGEKVLAGTAFFLSHSNQSSPDRRRSCVVTAKHVIDKIKDKGINSIWLRLNLKLSGAIWIKTEVSWWNCHPSDPVADVSIAPIQIMERMDHKTVPLEMCITRKVIAEQKVDVGDELFLTGLFARHSGLNNNIPIVRVGNIAAMPQEKVRTELGYIDAYLIEARSIGGLSGSPVFVNLSGVRHGNLSLIGPKFYLLGLMHGHYDSDLFRSYPGEGTASIESVNMGIGIVVPIEKVVEIIGNPRFREVEEAWENLGRERRRLPQMD